MNIKFSEEVAYEIDREKHKRNYTDEVRELLLLLFIKYSLCFSTRQTMKVGIQFSTSNIESKQPNTPRCELVPILSINISNGLNPFVTGSI